MIGEHPSNCMCHMCLPGQDRDPTPSNTDARDRLIIQPHHLGEAPVIGVPETAFKSNDTKQRNMEIQVDQSVTNTDTTRNEFDDVDGVVSKATVDLMVNEYEGETPADHVYDLLCELAKSHEVLRGQVEALRAALESTVDKLNQALPLIRKWGNINSSMGPDLQEAGNILAGILASLPEEQTAYLKRTGLLKDSGR